MASMSAVFAQVFLQNRLPVLLAALHSVASGAKCSVVPDAPAVPGNLCTCACTVHLLLCLKHYLHAFACMRRALFILLLCLPSLGPPSLGAAVAAACIPSAPASLPSCTCYCMQCVIPGPLRISTAMPPPLPPLLLQVDYLRRLNRSGRSETVIQVWVGGGGGAPWTCGGGRGVRGVRGGGQRDVGGGGGEEGG